MLMVQLDGLVRPLELEVSLDLAVRVAQATQI